MGKNSRERHKAKQKAAAQRHHTPAAERIPPPRQSAEEVIADAIRARHRQHAGELKRCRGLLAGDPGGAAGGQVVNRTLFTMLLHDVRQAWERGWQPAELVRMARREHTARHGRLMADAVAAKMREYAAATVDPRWQAQIVALEARVWWGHDDHYVDAVGEQHDLDRATAIDHLLDLIYLLRILPPIEPTGPVPGAAQQAWQTTARRAADVDQRMLDRVRALLAKAESTDFPEEAETYTAKAQQLMARYSIDHALLAAGAGGHDKPLTRRVGIDNPYEVPKSLLLQVVAEANRCRTVWTKRFGMTTVVGFPADLDSTELLFTSLLVQATRAMTALNPRPDRHGRNNIRSFRQSFLTAYALRIGERLNAATEEVGREVATEMAASAGGSNLLPELAARSDAVDETFAAQFPELTSHSLPVNNREGWASGRAAAERAILHGRQPVSR